MIKLQKVTALKWSSTRRDANKRHKIEMCAWYSSANGSHVPRFMELFVAERSKAVLPRCRHGHLKRKYLRPPASTLGFKGRMTKVNFKLQPLYRPRKGTSLPINKNLERVSEPVWKFHGRYAFLFPERNRTTIPWSSILNPNPYVA